MTLPRTIKCSLRLERGKKGSHRLTSTTAGTPLPSGRTPRIGKLLALAHKFDGLLCQGAVADYATLARLGRVSRARITQIMNLLYLASDIQEEILFLAPSVRGRDPIHLRQLQPIACILDWHEQHNRWRALGPIPDSGASAAPEENISASCPKSPGGHSPGEVTD